MTKQKKTGEREKKNDFYDTFSIDDWNMNLKSLNNFWHLTKPPIAAFDQNQIVQLPE